MFFFVCTGFLIFELILRLWSSTYIKYYNRPGLKGIIAYFKAYSFQRSMDLIGIVNYILSVIANYCSINVKLVSIIRVGQIFQILQSNRILFAYMKLIANTICGSQRVYLSFTFFLAFITWVFSSVIIYLTEMDSKTAITNLFESFYFVYETFTTVG